MNSSSRRDFLKKTAVGSAAGLTAKGFMPRISESAEAPGFRRTVFRELGSTGCMVSEIGFGTMNTRDAELVHAAIDSGITYIDTANVYMNGANEEIVGSVMKTKRDKVFLTTKVGLNKDYSAIPRETETSLNRLKTDRVDLLLLHKTDSRTEILDNDVIKLFDDAKKRGQTRFVGISTHNFESEPFDAVIESKFWDAILTGYNPFTPDSVRQSIKKAREAGIAVIGMKNLITMTWPPSTRKPVGDIRKDTSSKTTPQQALIKWVLDDKHVDTIIPGMTTFEHLEDNLAVMGMKLSVNDRKIIRKLTEDVRSRYCSGMAGCTGCADQCPYGVKVYEINRCLGYAYGYGDKRLAFENYKNLPAENKLDACDNCDECSVKCVNGLNLTENIRMARNLFC